MHVCNKELVSIVLLYMVFCLFAGTIQHLKIDQTATLRRIFGNNVSTRRELKRHECEAAIKSMPEQFEVAKSEKYNPQLDYSREKENFSVCKVGKIIE